MPSPKFKSVIDEAIVRILSRASNSRGLSAQDLDQRVNAALDKYVFAAGAAPDPGDVKAFVDEIRADDLCLVIACERGDDRAWSDLVRDYDSAVRSAARRICPNPADADDLAGSIWAELHGLKTDELGKVKSKLSYYSGRGSLGGWLRAIVSQLAVDEFRKQSRFVQVEEDREFDNLASDAADKSEVELVSRRDNPEEELSRKQTREDIYSAMREAVSRLQDEDRLIMKLYYFDGLTLKEIASTFGFHEATASRRLVKIQASVRESVESILSKQRGWTQEEVARNLSSAASDIESGLEVLFKALIFLAIVQEVTGGIVL